MEDSRRTGFAIMKNLIGLIKPMLPIMFMAIVLGTIGYLCAIFLTILAGYVLLTGLSPVEYTAGTLFTVLIVIAVARGFLHYGEQYCNHYIAFKLLAFIRNRVFYRLRKLCPAKLEGRDRGDLISVITTDIELLEVFYAHTISPILIALSVSIIMIVFIGMQSVLAGVLAALAYMVVGVLIPVIMGRRGGESGMKNRNGIGEMNSFMLESLRGLEEIVQYAQQEKRLSEISNRSVEISVFQKELNKLEALQRGITNLAVFAASVGMLLLMLNQYNMGAAKYTEVIIAVIAMMGSFGPVIALSNLSNNLNQTLASGERVLNLLEEEPVVKDVVEGENVEFNGACAENVNFSYEDEVILQDYNFDIEEGKMTVIHGASGSGKSTLLKLLMRFWDVDSGKIKLSDTDIREINTWNLREMESYVTQETYLFHDSIASNIVVGSPGADIEAIRRAAEKASLHEFIMTLPEGYDTKLGELGDTISGGEKQRIGLSRAFLHDAPLLLLDEPTSNLDSLNEGIVLKSLKEGAGEKTVIMVTHRESTMGNADVIIEMDGRRRS